jgi:hypothetical protein
MSIVKALHKKGDKARMTNYMTVALFNTFSKVLRRLYTID